MDDELKTYAPLVRRLAHQMISRLPANVEFDDLFQMGMLGLMDAISRFDPDRGIKFETFATQRIRGNMLDELRNSDYLARSVRAAQRSVGSAVSRAEQHLGRKPTEGEIAAEVGVSLADYQNLIAGAYSVCLVYLEDLSDDGTNDFLGWPVQTPGPPEILEDQERRAAVAAAFTCLRKREQYVLELFYVQGVMLKDMAILMGVSSSRVTQIHREAISQLKHKVEILQRGRVSLKL